MSTLKPTLQDLYLWGGIVEIFGDEGTGKTLLAQNMAHRLCSTRHPQFVYFDPTATLGTLHHTYLRTDREHYLYFTQSSLQDAFALIEGLMDTGSHRIFVLDPLPAFSLSGTPHISNTPEPTYALAQAVTTGLRKLEIHLYTKRCILILVNHLHFFSDDGEQYTAFTPGGKLLKQLACLRLQCLECRPPQISGTILRNTLNPSKSTFQHAC